jgi:hypothetical protein
MARRAGVNEDYRARGAIERAAAQKKSNDRVEMMRRIMSGYEPAAPSATPAHGGECVNPGSVPAVVELRNPQSFSHYQWLLNELRQQLPFKDAAEAPLRPNLPM